MSQPCSPVRRSALRRSTTAFWLVSFMDYDLGYIELEQRTLQPLDNPFAPRLSPTSPVRIGVHPQNRYLCVRSGHNFKWCRKRDTTPSPHKPNNHGLFPGPGSPPLDLTVWTLRKATPFGCGGAEVGRGQSDQRPKRTSESPRSLARHVPTIAFVRALACVATVRPAPPAGSSAIEGGPGVGGASSRPECCPRLYADG